MISDQTPSTEEDHEKQLKAQENLTFFGQTMTACYDRQNMKNSIFPHSK